MKLTKLTLAILATGLMASSADAAKKGAQAAKAGARGAGHALPADEYDDDGTTPTDPPTDFSPTRKRSGRRGETHYGRLLFQPQRARDP